MLVLGESGGFTFNLMVLSEPGGFVCHLMVLSEPGGFKCHLMVLSEPGGFNFNLMVTLVIGLLFDCLSLDCAGLNNITGITPDNHPTATWSPGGQIHFVQISLYKIEFLTTKNCS